MKRKDIESKAEKWYSKKHNEIETSFWIGIEMKLAYKRMLTQAYKEGYQSAIKENIVSSMKGETK